VVTRQAKNSPASNQASTKPSTSATSPSAGIPSSASNAAGNSMTVTFFTDGSSTQLGSPVTVSLDHPQSVHLNLDGSSQLEIACAAISQTSHSAVSMDGALGNATIGPS
jgi:hypothetical protein